MGPSCAVVTSNEVVVGSFLIGYSVVTSFKSFYHDLKLLVVFN